MVVASLCLFIDGKNSLNIQYSIFNLYQEPAA